MRCATVAPPSRAYEFTETDDGAIGNVADGDLAGEGNEVVLAHGKDFNVAHNNHLVVILAEQRIVDHAYVFT